MIKEFKKISILALFIIMLISLVSCGDDATKANLSILNGVETDGVYSVYVSSSTESINLEDYLTVAEDAKLKIYTSVDMKDEIDANVSLQAGENIFYVRVKESGVKKDYTVKIIKRKTVTVTFDSNGGSVCQPIVVDEGTLVNTPTTTRSGYDFVKWDYDFTKPITEDISCKAEWVAKTYTITIENGQPVDVKFGQEYSLTPAIPATGYKFVKWIDSNGNDFPKSGVWDKTDNVSIKAVFAKEVYKISYVYNADIPLKNTTYTVEDEVILEIPVHPDGLEFEGWYTDSQLKNKIEKIEKGNAGDVTVYAKWKIVVIPEPPVYTITIDADGYEFDGNTIELKYGDSYELPTVPEKAGYDFVAWMNGTTVIPTSGIWSIRDNATLTIKWQARKYNVEYVFDSKTTNPNTTTEFTPETETIILLEPTRPNATFLGWYTDPDFTDESKITQISKGTTVSITLYAKFEITMYMLTYSPNGGTVSKDFENYELGDSYTLLTPEFPGYKFVGWYNGEELVENNGTWSIETDVTFVAKWEKERYLVTYDLANGTTSETLKVSYSVDDTFTLPKPTREGYYFLGWSEKDSNKTYYDMTVQKGSTGNKTFVAKWSEFSYSFNGENAIVTNYKFITSRARVKIPTTVNYNGVDYTVTEIGASVFEGMGPIIKNKLIVTTNSKGEKVVATKFDVEIPRTLKKIGVNAFANCNDVCIKIILDSGVDIYEWTDSLEIAEGNKDVADVIKGRRPAIGWSIYG